MSTKSPRSIHVSSRAPTTQSAYNTLYQLITARGHIANSARLGPCIRTGSESALAERRCRTWADEQGERCSAGPVAARQEKSRVRSKNRRCETEMTGAAYFNPVFPATLGAVTQGRLVGTLPISPRRAQCEERVTQLKESLRFRTWENVVAGLRARRTT